MAGLNLAAGGSARVRASAGVGPATASQPAGVAEAAFGPGASSSVPARRGVLLPNDAFGITLWSGVAALGLLLVVRHSLPR